MMYPPSIAELEERIQQQAKMFGPDHPDQAENIRLLAHSYFVVGRYAEAESLLWRTISIISKSVGEDDLVVSDLLIDLGYLYEIQHEFSQAEHAYRLSHAIKSRTLGKTHAESLRVARSVVVVCRAQYKRRRGPTLMS